MGAKQVLHYKNHTLWPAGMEMVCAEGFRAVVCVSCGELAFQQSERFKRIEPCGHRGDVRWATPDTTDMITATSHPERVLEWLDVALNVDYWDITQGEEEDDDANPLAT